MPIRVPIERRSDQVFPSPLAGRVHIESFESQLLKGNPWADPHVRDLPVYLPPSGRTEGLPLLVLLTGFTGAGWIHFERPRFFQSTIVRRFDQLIQSGAIPEAVLVAPDCLTTLGGSQYLNSSATGPYEDYVTKEILPWVRDRYRTGPTGLLGTSSGGFGSLVLALRHPDLFAAAASNSGDAYFEYAYLPEFPTVVRALHRAGGPEALLHRVLAEPTSDFGPWNPDIQAVEMMAYASAYSPVPDRPGEFELPFDLDTGALRDEVWPRWLDWDPVRMVRRPEYTDALRRLRLLYVDGGTKDEYGLDLGARVFAAEARAHGARVEHAEFDGVHADKVPRYDLMFRRLASVLAPP